MGLKITHNGRDITKLVDLSSCVLHDRYGGMLDSISLSFPEKSTDFEFYRYDEIVVESEDYDSGVMYVDECIFMNSNYILNAISYKAQNRKKSSGFWKYIKLLQIATDIAKANGLTLKTYGVHDYTYESLTRIDETDLEFLSRICKREGYSIKIYDGSLIIFNEYEIENNSKPLEISASEVDPSYNFKRATNGISELAVRHFHLSTGSYIEATARDKDIESGAMKITEYVKDANEAQRFANGYLRDKNKNYINGCLSMALNPKISAGTVLSANGFSEFSGKYVTYEVTHDLKNEKTYLKIRGTLNY